MGQLMSKVWVSASFHIFVLTAWEKCPGWEGNYPGGEMSRRIGPRGDVHEEMSYTPIQSVML